DTRAIPIDHRTAPGSRCGPLRNPNATRAPHSFLQHGQRGFISSVLKNAARLLQSHDTRQRGVKDAGKRTRARWDVSPPLDGSADSPRTSLGRGEAEGGTNASPAPEKVRVA